MAKKKNTKSRNTKKDVKKKIDEMEVSASNEIYKVLKIVFGVLVFLGIFYLITIAIVGREEKEEIPEATIQYEEILAGSSFTMRDDEYLVVYYDFEDEEMSNLYSAVYSYTYSGSKRLYTVNMSNGFNSKYVSEKSNKEPKDAGELAINGPTLISIKDGKVDEYIEGSDNIISYLS